MELHDRLAALGATPAAHPASSDALCRLLAAEVSPVYSAMFPQVSRAAHRWGGVRGGFPGQINIKFCEVLGVAPIARILKRGVFP